MQQAVAKAMCKMRIRMLSKDYNATNAKTNIQCMHQSFWTTFRTLPSALWPKGLLQLICKDLDTRIDCRQRRHWIYSLVNCRLSLGALLVACRYIRCYPYKDMSDRRVTDGIVCMVQPGQSSALSTQAGNAERNERWKLQCTECEITHNGSRAGV
jgi:hypothetical protein